MRVKGFGYRPDEGPGEIDRQRRVWESKPQVRSFYQMQVFPRITRELPSAGPCVEVGSGAGTFKDSEPAIVATDVIDCPWIDVRCTGLNLPFRDGSVTGLVAINVLHHLPSIGPFLQEAARVLSPGGRFVCVEPWITPVSRVFYRWFHQEDSHLVDDALLGTNTTDDRPMHGNTYIPYQAFRDSARLQATIPALRLTLVEPFSCLGWCMSKGFREGAMLPDRYLRLLLRFEDWSNRWWSRTAGLNALIVFERIADAPPTPLG